MSIYDVNLGNGILGRVGAACAACALLATPGVAQDNGTAADDGVRVSDYDTVDITVQDTDLAQVLQMLSIQSQKNIITSKNVSATVTANLYNVTFHEALDAILKVNGYGYIEEGNFIYIYTQEELEEIEKSRRTLESRTFNLDYLSAVDAYEFIGPLLSDVGRAAYRGEVAPGIKPDTSDTGADSYAYTSMLVVNDYAENLERIAEMLTEVDTPPSQVLVEAVILSSAIDEANAFGIDFSIIGSVDFDDFVNPLSPVTGLANGSDEDGFQPEDDRAVGVQSNAGNINGPGTLKIGVIADDISVFLRVLDEVTDSTVLARPKIMALNRQRAEVLVGARVGYLSTTATETTTTQTVEFLDTGIQLIFRPFISKNGMVRLELAPSVSEASLRTVTDSNGQLVTIPDELTNELTTNVRVRDGETLILGGLFREATTVTRRQVPYLGDVPILGAAFRGQDDTIERNEIIFLITPSIMNDERLWEFGEEALSYSDTVMFGARQNLLPFSRERQTLSYNKRAAEAFERGDMDEALMYTNKSLHLSKIQPEMIRFKERIVGKKIEVHERSIMRRIMDQELGEMPSEPSVRGPQMPYRSPLNMTDEDMMQQANEYDDVLDFQSFNMDSNSNDDSTSNRPTFDSGSEMTWNGSSASSSTPSAADDFEQWQQSRNRTSTNGNGSNTFGTSSNDWSANEWNGTPLSSTNGSNGSLSDEFYREMLVDLFTTIGMPEMAAEFASEMNIYSQNNSSGTTTVEVTEQDNAPFLRFEDVFQYDVAGANDDLPY